MIVLKQIKNQVILAFYLKIFQKIYIFITLQIIIASYYKSKEREVRTNNLVFILCKNKL